MLNNDETFPTQDRLWQHEAIQPMLAATAQVLAGRIRGQLALAPPRQARPMVKPLHKPADA
jgi:hypothetical protein